MININPVQIYNKHNSFGQNNRKSSSNNNEVDIKLKYPFHYGKNILLDLPIAISAYSSLKKDEKFLKTLVFKVLFLYNKNICVQHVCTAMHIKGRVLWSLSPILMGS